MAADLFHAGHVSFLTKVRARFPGAHVTVWLATDDQILDYKGHPPVMPYDCRKIVLESCRLVDCVEQAPDVYTSEALAPFDYLCHGDDLLRWDETLKERFYGAASREGKLVTVPYTSGISTTRLIERCKTVV
jgi:cytidyltransferase-like protein